MGSMLRDYPQSGAETEGPKCHSRKISRRLAVARRNNSLQPVTATGQLQPATATDLTERATVVRPSREKKIISVTLIALRFGSRHSLAHSLPRLLLLLLLLLLLISRRSIAINELTVIADRLPIAADLIAEGVRKRSK